MQYSWLSCGIKCSEREENFLKWENVNEPWTKTVSLHADDSSFVKRTLNDDGIKRIKDRFVNLNNKNPTNFRETKAFSSFVVFIKSFAWLDGELFLIYK